MSVIDSNRAHQHIRNQLNAARMSPHLSDRYRIVSVIGLSIFLCHYLSKKLFNVYQPFEKKDKLHFRRLPFFLMVLSAT